MLCLIGSIAVFSAYSSNPGEASAADDDSAKAFIERTVKEYSERDTSFQSISISKFMLKIAMMGASKEERAGMKGIESMMFAYYEGCPQEMKDAFAKDIVEGLPELSLLGTESDEELGEMSIYGIVLDNDTKVKNPIAILSKGLMICIFGTMSEEDFVDMAKDSE